MLLLIIIAFIIVAVVANFMSTILSKELINRGTKDSFFLRFLTLLLAILILGSALAFVLVHIRPQK